VLAFGVDKFMSECRALVSVISNAVATLVICHWDRTLDVDRAAPSNGLPVPELGDISLRQLEAEPPTP